MAYTIRKEKRYRIWFRPNEPQLDEILSKIALTKTKEQARIALLDVHPSAEILKVELA